MRIFYTVIFGIVWMLFSCGSEEDHKEESNVRTISKEHAALLGEWEEMDSIVTSWRFDLDEVKWKGFSHMYRLSGDTLLISGLHYQIASQNENELTLITSNGKQLTLVRKK